MNQLIISVSGLRGIIGDSLTPDVAIRYTAAFAEVLPPGPIVVTRDGRHTGHVLEAAVHSALLAMGRECLDAGIAATPTTGVLIYSLKAAGGIQVSASHNPPEYNGIKLFNSDGRVIPAPVGQQVMDRYHAGKPRWKLSDELGVCEEVADATTTHRDLVLATCDVEKIKRRKFRIVVDANHGSGSVLAEPLFEALGCEVTMLGGKSDGMFAHPPEPTRENLQSVLQKVRDAKADIGFCQDPDADRLAIVDEKGNYIGEEYTLALAVDHILRSNRGPVVTNCSTSRMTKDLAAKYDVPFFHSKVGEANVVDLMLVEEAVIGGEGNGGVIDPRVGLVRDSFVGMALVLDAMATREKAISDLVAELPHYAIHKAKVSLPAERISASLVLAQEHFGDASCDSLDGLRFDWNDKWLLVRASNTEPIVRIIAEAPTAEEAKRLCDEAEKVMRC